MAEEQSRLALVLGHSTMFYKCLIYQAYNYVYNAQFDAARNLIRRVERESTDPVIRQMCGSALLFCDRVSKMAHVLRQAEDEKEGHKTPRERRQYRLVDDLARIRLVKDRSSQDDMIRPFQKPF